MHGPRLVRASIQVCDEWFPHVHRLRRAPNICQCEAAGAPKCGTSVLELRSARNPSFQPASSSAKVLTEQRFVLARTHSATGTMMGSLVPKQTCRHLIGGLLQPAERAPSQWGARAEMIQLWSRSA